MVGTRDVGFAPGFFQSGPGLAIVPKPAPRFFIELSSFLRFIKGINPQSDGPDPALHFIGMIANDLQILCQGIVKALFLEVESGKSKI